ncbi:hypothetical protein B296_00004737 [Ensete ventricosum]|uniref:Uncharacterized protein n=1 Tax=Ensete ventricosum TaxID=4639 RepID=A0A427AFD5_ENSVE|nr:hypothetical protein B296_00004737 [Ensete ventricosum]
MRERLTVLSLLALSPSSWSSSFVTVAEGDSRESDELALGSNYHGSIAECLARKEFELGTKTTRRIILAHSYYISDNALRRNNVPCSRLGASYYNCHPVVEGQPLLLQLLHHHPQTKVMIHRRRGGFMFGWDAEGSMKLLDYRRQHIPSKLKLSVHGSPH